MTVQTALERAKPLIDNKTFDQMDLRNLLNCVYTEGYRDGRGDMLTEAQSVLSDLEAD